MSQNFHESSMSDGKMSDGKKIQKNQLPSFSSESGLKYALVSLELTTG